MSDRTWWKFWLYKRIWLLVAILLYFGVLPNVNKAIYDQLNKLADGARVEVIKLIKEKTGVDLAWKIQWPTFVVVPTTEGGGKIEGVSIENMRNLEERVTKAFNIKIKKREYSLPDTQGISSTYQENPSTTVFLHTSFKNAVIGKNGKADGVTYFFRLQSNNPTLDKSVGNGEYHALVQEKLPVFETIATLNTCLSLYQNALNEASNNKNWGKEGELINFEINPLTLVVKDEFGNDGIPFEHSGKKYHLRGNIKFTDLLGTSPEDVHKVKDPLINGITCEN